MNHETGLCMVDCVKNAFPHVDREPLDTLRREQFAEPMGDLDDDAYFQLQRQEFAALLERAGVQHTVGHQNIFDPNPSEAERRLLEALATHKTVFLPLSPTYDVQWPHVAHLTQYADPYIILDGEQIHVELIYDQLFAVHRLDIFTVE